MITRVPGVPDLVFGVPKTLLPLRTDIPGKVRYRFRNLTFAWVFIRSATGIRKFAVGVADGHWFPTCEQARNERLPS